MADLEFEHPTFGPWTGVNESSPGPSDVLRAFNVDFEDGRVRRRRGRALLGSILGSVPVAGIFQHTGLNGERVVLVGFNQTVAGTAGAALKALDGNGMVEVTDIPIPNTGGQPSFSDLPWSFASYRGFTVMADPCTNRLIYFDGSAAGEVKAFDGLDKSSGLIGARSYLSGSPPSRRVDAWRNRIVSIFRRTIGLSATHGDINIPYDAPLGAPNVWPARQNFDVITKVGDEIVATAVVQDRLHVLTRGGAALVDEDEISPVVQVRDRKYGCIAAGSVQECAQEVFYLADGMVVSFDGSKIVDVSSEELAQTLKLVNWAIADRAVSVHLARRNEYRIWLPVEGSTQNRLCLIFNYVRRKWRVYVGALPWLSESEQNTLQPYDVTAAAAVLSSTNEEVLLTGDSLGRIWLEDSEAEDDFGSIFPAFFLLPELGEGQRPLRTGSLRVDALMDGSWIRAWELIDGARFEEEYVRWPLGLPLRSEVAIARALRDDHYCFNTSGVAWDIHPHVPDPGNVVFSMRRHATRVQIAIEFPGAKPLVGGTSTSSDTARGGIRALELSVSGLKAGRTKERSNAAVHDGEGGPLV